MEGLARPRRPAAIATMDFEVVRLPKWRAVVSQVNQLLGTGPVRGLVRGPVAGGLLQKSMKGSDWRGLGDRGARIGRQPWRKWPRCGPMALSSISERAVCRHSDLTLGRVFGNSLPAIGPNREICRPRLCQVVTASSIPMPGAMAHLARQRTHKPSWSVSRRSYTRQLM